MVLFNKFYYTYTHVIKLNHLLYIIKINTAPSANSRAYMTDREHGKIMYLCYIYGDFNRFLVHYRVLPKRIIVSGNNAVINTSIDQLCNESTRKIKNEMKCVFSKLENSLSIIYKHYHNILRYLLEIEFIIVHLYSIRSLLWEILCDILLDIILNSEPKYYNINKCFVNEHLDIDNFDFLNIVISW